MTSSIGRRILLLLPAAALLARCAGAPEPAELALSINAGPDQNPDPAGQPTAVAIRLYQLASAAAFARADVFALSEHEAATLGTDGLGSEEIDVAPGESRVVRHPLKPGAQILGVVALFRDIDNAVWRAQASLKPSGTTKLSLTTAGIKLAIT